MADMAYQVQFTAPKGCVACQWREKLIRQCAFPQLGGVDLSDEAEAEAEKTRFFSLKCLRRFFRSIEEHREEWDIALPLSCSCQQCTRWRNTRRDTINGIQYALSRGKADLIRLLAALIYLNRPHLIYPLFEHDIKLRGVITDANVDALQRDGERIGQTAPDRRFFDALGRVSYWFEPAQFQSKTPEADLWNLDWDTCRLPLIPDKQRVSRHPSIKIYRVREEHVDERLRATLEEGYWDDAVDDSEDGKHVCSSPSALRFPLIPNLADVIPVRATVSLCSQARA